MFLGSVAVFFGLLVIIGSLPLIWTPVGWVMFALGAFFIWGGSQAF